MQTVWSETISVEKSSVLWSGSSMYLSAGNIEGYENAIHLFKRK